MTAAQFATYVRFKTKTNTTTFTDAEILALMAIRQDEIAKTIIKADEDILLIPQDDDLVASSVAAREYPMPTDILSRIKRVEAKLDGTDWVKLTSIDLKDIERPTNTESDITNNFSNERGKAFYDIRRKSIYIYSGTIIAGTDTLKVWIKTWPAAITNLAGATDMSIDPSTTTHGIPRSMHEIWARGVIIDYKGSKEKPLPLNEGELSYDKDLQLSLEALMHANLDEEVFGKLPPKSDRGNDGFDY